MFVPLVVPDMLLASTLPNEPVEVDEPLICFPLLEILKASNVAFELSTKNPILLRLVFS